MSDLHPSQDPPPSDELYLDTADDFEPPEQSEPEPVDPPVGGDGYPISGSGYKTREEEAG